METEHERLELFRSRASQHAGKRPLYRVVEDHIRDLINGGELIPGDLIPSEPQLARTLGVSPGTVKKAIDNLVWEGLLYRHQGKGTYISKVDFGKSLFRFFSYGDARGRAVRIHKETTSRRRCIGPASVTRRLHVPDGSELIYI